MNAEHTRLATLFAIATRPADLQTLLNLKQTLLNYGKIAGQNLRVLEDMEKRLAKELATYSAIMETVFEQHLKEKKNASKK